MHWGYLMIYFKNKNYLFNEIRPPFTKEVKKRLSGVPDDHICHCLSFNSIQKIVCHSLNGRLTHELHRLWSALSNNVNSDKVYAIVEKIGEGYFAGKPPGYLIEAANSLLEQLNSAVNNLRKGNPEWKQRISDYYDPQNWYYYNGEAITASSQGFGRNTCIYYPPVPGRHGFYIEDSDKSGTQLYRLRNELSFYSVSGFGRLTIIQGSFMVKDSALSILFSSDNNFPVPQDIRYTSEPIYYRCDRGWVQLDEPSPLYLS